MEQPESALVSFLFSLQVFVHPLPTFSLWCVRTTVKITKQILINLLVVCHNSLHLAPEYPFQPTPQLMHQEGGKVETCLVK